MVTIRSLRKIGILESSDKSTSKESHPGLSKNRTFTEAEESTLDRMVGDVASNKVQAMSIFCTNLRAT